MKVISKKSNKKLLKDHVYETDFFNNDKSTVGVRYDFKRISIVGKGNYNVDNFTLTNGDPIPLKLYDSKKKSNITDVKDLKKGDIIVCLSDNRFKYLIEGGKYRIKDLLINSTNTWVSGSIKIEGYDRWLRWSQFTFRKLSIQEKRDLSLSQIFDKEENFSVEFKRKFEQKEDKDRVLIETIAKSILDRHRHDLGLIDWACDKNGGHLKVTPEDFKHLMDKPLKEIIEIIDNQITK